MSPAILLLFEGEAAEVEAVSAVGTLRLVLFDALRLGMAWACADAASDGNATISSPHALPRWRAAEIAVHPANVEAWQTEQGA